MHKHIYFWFSIWKILIFVFVFLFNQLWNFGIYLCLCVWCSFPMRLFWPLDHIIIPCLSLVNPPSLPAYFPHFTLFILLYFLSLFKLFFPPTCFHHFSQFLKKNISFSRHFTFLTVFFALFSPFQCLSQILTVFPHFHCSSTR